MNEACNHQRAICYSKTKGYNDQIKWCPILQQDRFKRGIPVNVKLISCLALHGKRFNAECAKIILFSLKKKSMPEKEFLILSNCHGNDFFMKEFTWKIFTIAISPNSWWKRSVFSVQIRFEWKPVWLVGDFSQCTIALLKFLYFFRLNWVGCLFHCNTGTFRKQSFFYPDVP